MACIRTAERFSARSEGFTLVELLISVVLSVIIMGASLSFAVTTFRDTEGNALREEVYRSARFVGMALERDIQTTGVGIESQIRFGTLSTFNDTLVVLHVPWIPTDAPLYSIDPPGGTNNPLDPGGTCGPNCIDVNKAMPGNTFDLVPGDLARLQINTVRRVIRITNVQSSSTTVAVTFAADTTLLHYDAAFKGGVLLDRFSTFIQKLEPIVFYTEGETLYRADKLDTKMIFVDGDEYDQGDPNDSDLTNDFDDIFGVRISVTLGTNRPDIRVAGGGEFTRDYEWKLLPRNLMYERNR